MTPITTAAAVGETQATGGTHSAGSAEHFQAFCNRLWDTDEDDPILQIPMPLLRRIYEEKFIVEAPECVPGVGNQLADDRRNWPEDFPHENGNYQNQCVDCGLFFIGYKRRFVCKLCHERERPSTPSQGNPK